MQLLFTCAHWHALAKLWMHTDLTLDIMDDATTSLGTQCRNFQTNICAAYATRELQREVRARERRQSGKVKAGTRSKQSKPCQNNGSKKKSFNLQTYKYHALGDYVMMIRRYGTTDSYSTEPVSIHNSLLLVLISIDRESWSTATQRLDIVVQTANHSSSS
jgi:hypothetical protein